MADIQSNISNVLLVLCLDTKNSSPLESRSGPLVDENGRYHLVAGVLGPGHREASAPVTGIELNRSRRKTYNEVLTKFQEISSRFYRRDGFISKPESYTDEKQGETLNAILEVGRNTYDLFEDSPIRGWLHDLWKANPAAQDRPIQNQPVTIITNDFNIPWFWLKGPADAPLLCEVCSLGMLQLSAAGRAQGLRAPAGREDRTYEALLIKDPTGLPFLDSEFDGIKKVLEDSSRWTARTFKVHSATTPEEISRLGANDKHHLLSSFRIVHFGGRYSGKILKMGTLEPILNSSLLVLDGSSDSRELDGWNDLKGLTSKIMETDAIGCVLNVLPVKHDPIASNILWESFYRQLKIGTVTVGQALANARIDLRNHFKDIGSQNPMWAIYQLVGSPAVQLCYDNRESQSNG